MKKINLLILIISFSMGIVSCSSDDGDNNDTSGNILGVWNAVSVDYTGTSTLEFQGQTITLDFIGSGYDEDFTVTFSENPNIAISDGSYSVALSTTVLGQTTTQNAENLTFLEESEWSLDGNQLTFITNGESGTGTILELTDNTLIFSAETTDIIDGNQVELETITVFSR